MVRGDERAGEGESHTMRPPLMVSPLLFSAAAVAVAAEAADRLEVALHPGDMSSSFRGHMPRIGK